MLGVIDSQYNYDNWRLCFVIISWIGCAILYGYRIFNKKINEKQKIFNNIIFL